MKLLKMTSVAELEAKLKELKSLKNAELTPDDVIESTEIREDVSDKVKKLVHEIAKEGDYRFGVFVGNAGGKRKLIECPHCKSRMVVAGIKPKKVKKERKLTENQLEWQELIKTVRKLPQYADIGSVNHLKVAGELKRKGVSSDQLKKLL